MQIQSYRQSQNLRTKCLLSNYCSANSNGVVEAFAGGIVIIGMGKELLIGARGAGGEGAVAS